MKTFALGEVCTITMGQAPLGDSYNTRREGLPLIAGAGDFEGPHIAPKKFTTQPTKVANAGDIVLSIRASIGAKVWSDGRYCLGRGVAGLRANPDLDPSFLWHWLSYFGRALTAKGRGATFLQVNRSDISEMPIDLPPLDEQRRIAAILNHADAIRAKRRQVLTHLDTLTQSIFTEMFSEVPTTTPLSRLVQEFRYGTSNRAGDIGSPTLRIPNVIGGGLDLGEVKRVPVRPAELERLRLLSGDILFVRSNGNPENVGRSAVFDPQGIAMTDFASDPWIFASYLIRARVSPSTDPTWLVAYLAGTAGRRALRGRSKTSAGQYNINIQGLGSLPIPVVATDLQIEFAARAGQVSLRRAIIQSALAAADELFASLQSRAFRGEL